MVSSSARYASLTDEQRARQLEKAREYKKNNAAKIKADRAAYYEANKEKEAELQKVWHAANPAAKPSYDIAYRENNSAILKEKRSKNKDRRNERDRNRYATDPVYATEKRLRASLTQALRLGGACKNASILNLLGCSIPELMVHLENQFLEGMSWENRTGWHIDHRRPCASFDLTDPEQQRACFHHSNLQPLWCLDNHRKGAKWNA